MTSKFDPVEEEFKSDRPVDQIYCDQCGRPMLIWADEPVEHLTCGRCLNGLTPEWEY
jgi:hypothetical protein